MSRVERLSEIQRVKTDSSLSSSSFFTVDDKASEEKDVNDVDWQGVCGKDGERGEFVDDLDWTTRRGEELRADFNFLLYLGGRSEQLVKLPNPSSSTVFEPRTFVCESLSSRLARSNETLPSFLSRSRRFLLSSLLK